MKNTGTFHYVTASNGGIILAVYGYALREQAFESAAKKRAAGIACETYTRSGYRVPVGMRLPDSGKIPL